MVTSGRGPKPLSKPTNRIGASKRTESSVTRRGGLRQAPRGRLLRRCRDLRRCDLSRGRNVATATLIAEIQMKFARTCIAVAAIIGPGSLSGQATPQPRQSEIDSADRLFQVGKFAEAGKLYSQIATQNPKNYSGGIERGRI